MEKEIQIFKFSPAIFDPNEEQLELIKKEVSGITADPKKITGEQLKLVATTRKKLMKARTTIKAVGKAAREEANQYTKQVLAYEHKLVDIIEPEEVRLKSIEIDSKEYATRKARKATLPEYKEKLASIGDGITVKNDELLSMDPTQFQEYYNNRLTVHLEIQKLEAEKNAAIKEAELKAKEQILQDEKDAIERDKLEAVRIKEAEKTARLEAKKEAEQKAAALEAERLTQIEDEKKAKEEEAQKIEQEKKERESQQRYQNWLSQFDYKEETHLVVDEDGVTSLYKLLGEYHHDA